MNNELVDTDTKHQIIDPLGFSSRAAIVRYVPLRSGVGIIPWNIPQTLGIGKLLAALLAGNTLIWKPSPFAPYSALKLAEIGAKVLPPGVFQALSGRDDLVSVTGSAETGKMIMAACAVNDATVVCDDVDIDSITFFAFLHCSQICMNIKRIYAHKKIYNQFLDKIRQGLHMIATIIDNPPDDSRIVVDEPFGPIVPVLKWPDEDEVIKRIDAMRLGLGASVIWVNNHFELAPNVPYGGHKESGQGMDCGEVGLKGWTNAQAYWVKYS
ncbi:Aldehyde/histidinol dehydrogenase [Xylariaceae sp. FL1019]|nr:Aldehyde/histidinol dehydrogenase [Xylariaceae sp. FL1019]